MSTRHSNSKDAITDSDDTFGVAFIVVEWLNPCCFSLL